MRTKWNHAIMSLFAAVLILTGAGLAVPQSRDNVLEKIDKHRSPATLIDSVFLPGDQELFRLEQAPAAAGDVDSSFVTRLVGAGTVHAVLLQTDLKMLVGGT